MDGSAVDHSDSDSGESWTLLDHSENSPAADDAPIFQQNEIEQERTIAVQGNEKDDDTDGISIISDSDPETTPCDLSYDKGLLADEHSIEQNTQYITTHSPPPNPNEHQKSFRSGDDFLGDSHRKLKTYVHRRNKRLSTVLNIIMLGSVITAAGVAIGHMWGARNDCTMHTTPTVNKILSNLYKLQEENAYLRGKLKELTLMTNTQLQKKSGADKFPVKQPRCRKIYEEALDKKNSDRITKCVDTLEPHLTQPEYEKEFLSDIEKLKNVYQQNKSWLNEEIAKRTKNEKETIKKLKNSIKVIDLSPVGEEMIESKDENVNDVIGLQKHIPMFESVKNEEQDSQTASEHLGKNNNVPMAMKTTYADSLKSAGEHVVKKFQKRDINVKLDKDMYKWKGKKHQDLPPEVIISEEDFIKDNRYVGSRMKQQWKKHDHHKLHKKQKRKNKYEQWEMKGGIMKDYDVLSMTSSTENEHILRNLEQSHLNKDVQNKQLANDDIPKIRIIDTDMPKNKHTLVTDKVYDKKAKDVNWYDKRASLRTEARRRLELELFGEGSANNGGWYFRRMQRREQCRAKGDNSTYRKQSKRNMNFKMKH